MTAIDQVLSAMRTRLRPDAAARRRLDAAVRSMQACAQEIRAELAPEHVPDFEPMLVGSAAKDTWIPGHVDLDLFLLFDPKVPRDTLEAAGLRIGKAMIPEWTLRYAEHPYVHGVYDGFDADVVPAYRVPSAHDIQSAVDRTPFHNRYVRAAVDKEPALKDEIRLAKAWLRGVDAYGAETALGGVSGYLAEVLVLHHRGLSPLLAAMRTWRPGVRLDPGAHSKATFPDDVLVVIDPVDPGRNAASAVRRDKFDRLVEAAEAFLRAPAEAFFFPRAAAPLDAATATRLVGGSGLVVVRLPVPDMREDARGPHLRRAAEALAARLGREGFAMTSSDGGMLPSGEAGYLLVRSATAELPATRTHHGPPLRVADRVADFRRKYDDHPDVVRAPYETTAEGVRRVAVDLNVRERALQDRVASAFAAGVSLGKHLDAALAAHAPDILDAAAAVSDPELERVLAEVLCPLPPWERTGDASRDYAPRTGSKVPSTSR